MRYDNELQTAWGICTLLAITLAFAAIAWLTSENSPQRTLYNACTSRPGQTIITVTNGSITSCHMNGATITAP